ncbi:neutral zinc metallopeptidase [Chitinivorax sp. B]|uniref:KPN_02809 family neutral zinc metallopeptidase n=1 Tax=Chitinivorax sp. B TaxID=2502235 RepID=UPI0010F8C184|nr:neutral zinc metallopeptidase [Chitinivorax sp. B]
MRWDDMRQSDNVEDRRGEGGRGGLPVGGLSIGGIVAVTVISLLLGQNPLEMLGLLQPAQQTPQQAAPHTASNQPSGTLDKGKQLVSAVLGDTEDTWDRLFQQAGARYERPKLVLFRQAVSSACGRASSAVGPFYCPGDRKMYLDLGFFEELQQRFAAPGDFAQAYVIAHEVGHHVQNLMGVSGQVHQKQQGLGKKAANALSVQLELQADCLAGVWGHYAHQRKLLDPGDMEEALTAAHAIGDDTLQRNATGHVVPDAFTHGSSEQRMYWFKRGFETGDMRQCDTFSRGTS